MKTLLALSLALCMTATAFGAGSETEKLARDFVLLLSKEEYSKSVELFDTNLRKAAPPATLKAIWSSQLAKTGAYKDVKGTKIEHLGQYHAVFVTCQFEKKHWDVKVVFDKAGKIAGFFFVPTTAQYRRPSYAKSNSFKELKIQVGHGELVLPGTLTVPMGEGRFPAVILVHGSGPQDRDESIGPNKPFQDLACGLASQGIVVLRYEKRTRQYAAKLAKSTDKLTIQEETIADASKAVSILKKNEAVIVDRIFILGHSLGGMLIPRIYEKRPEIAGFVIMAGNARPLEDLILEQALFQSSLKDQLSDQEKANIIKIKGQVAAVKALSADSTSGPLILGAPRSYWLSLKGYKPAEAAKAIKRPIFIMQGEKDCQVSSTKDFGEWRRALSGRKNVEFKTYPTLNHLFMEVSGKSTGAEYHQPANIAEVVVADIVGWIKKH